MNLNQRTLALCACFFILSTAFFSCKEKESDPDLEGDFSVLISNEGAFATGEGTLSLYDPLRKETKHTVYKEQNGEAMGNVFQSIATYGEFSFLVVNNSGKIIKVDQNYKKVGEISGFTSARYMYIKDSVKAYVTDLFANHIWILDLQTMRIAGKVPTSGWTERAVWNGNDLLVTNPASTSLYVLDTETDQITDSLLIGGYPQSVTMDNSGNVWTLGSNGVAGVLQQFNSSLQWQDSVHISGSPNQLRHNPANDQLYYLNGGLYTSNGTTSVKVSGAKTMSYAYGLDIDPSNGDIYTSDALDFTQRSTVYRYSKEGTLLDEFKAGIISGGFFFKD